MEVTQKPDHTMHYSPDGRPLQTGEGKLASPWQRFLAEVIIPAALILVLAIGITATLGGVGVVGMGELWVVVYLALGWMGLDIYLRMARSQTIGKYFLNLQVVDVETGRRTGFCRYYFLRDLLGKSVLGMFPFYTFVDALFVFSNNNQTLHDRIAGTKVVELPEHMRRQGFIDFRQLPKIE